MNPTIINPWTPAALPKPYANSGFQAQPNYVSLPAQNPGNQQQAAANIVRTISKVGKQIYGTTSATDALIVSAGVLAIPLLVKPKIVTLKAFDYLLKSMVAAGLFRLINKLFNDHVQFTELIKDPAAFLETMQQNKKQIISVLNMPHKCL